ncbi:MAG: aminomethyl-transferring glycine dehydrogenase subunit GcvPA [Spirochaetota bacterium]
MRYIPNTSSDIKKMLDTIGAESVDELFSCIPRHLLLKGDLNIPGPFSEGEILQHLKKLSRANASSENYTCFLGGGVYQHFIPSVVPALLARSEFYTAYTPYQPEVSQGTLQSIFEFQSFMCMLTGMEVSNASMYDGASSTAEAVLMARKITRRPGVILSQALNPEYASVIKTYLGGGENQVVEAAFNQNGVTDYRAVQEAISADTACVVVQYPNFLGIIENLSQIEKLTHQHQAMLIVAFSEPLSFGLVKPPGEFNADIVSGEGQSLGIPPSYGGPFLGILTAKSRYMRNMPGRISGQTTDIDGKRAFVLTLSAREQHIRREKSTSNICTNEGLCALAATIYLSALGKQGFSRLARVNHNKTEYAKDKLSRVPGVKLRFNSPTFNEFVLQMDKEPREVVDELSMHHRLIPGVPLGRFYEELSDCMLVAVTEMNTKIDIDRMCGLVGR